ncbi:ATP synthase gamma chain [hydrothermal vent metagenome]|uniref:ATP synthase gamma chain n=1 Tax=hydrothermal vent metagenome TaxID=652676 RepID=A0A3B1DXQ2_9ZZZZ
MANLKVLKEKLKSVKGTSKITKAMKLVSTVKLKRAEELAKQSKAYDDALSEVLKEISLIISKYGASDFFGNKFSSKSKEDIKTVDIIFVTSDKGMCGAFNAKTIKAVSNLIEKYEKKEYKIRLKIAGKKGNSYFSYRGYSVVNFISSAHPDYTQAATFISESIEDYDKGITSEVILVHNGFKNKLIQELHIKQMLPFDISNLKDYPVDSLLDIEPSDPKEILDSLMKKYVEFSMYFSLIDSLAAEHSARMQAMETATKNANEVVRTLNIKYNKARQSAVTNELIEIISGVEAMK